MAILTAIDIEQAPERSITVGYDLATAYDETLVVMYVMSQEQFDERQGSRDDLPEEFSEQSFSVDQAMDSATQKAATAVDATLDTYDREKVESRGRVGTPVDEILVAAEEIDPRFLVVGGRKRSVAKQALFGTVSQAIVRNAEQPVVTIMEETS